MIKYDRRKIRLELERQIITAEEWVTQKGEEKKSCLGEFKRVQKGLVLTCGLVSHTHF